LLNRLLVALSYIVVGDDLEGIPNMVVQLRYPPQLIQHRLVASLDVGQNLEHQQAYRQGHCGPPNINDIRGRY
jgi:hypothetical protein